MSDYNKITNFTIKDSLPSGNTSKIIKGTEIDNEFNAIQSSIASKADTNSPSFTGTPIAPTASAGTNTTQIATTAFVTSSPTINNANLTGTPTINNANLTGTPVAPTAAAGTNTTQVATTAHVFAERSNTVTLTNKTINLTNNTLVATSAQLAAALTDETGSGSAVFGTAPTISNANLTGVPVAPTASAGNNSTQVATTAYVDTKVIVTAGIADSAITTAKINDSAVTTAKINDAGVTTDKLASNAVTTAKITDANVTTAKIADSAVTTTKIADSNVTTAKIANANVTPAKLSQPLTQGTAWTYTSGTPSSIDFTGIPSWVTRITVTVTGLSFLGGGGGVSVIRIGSGSLETTGYDGTGFSLDSVTGTVYAGSVTNGFGNLGTGAGSYSITGHFMLTRLDGNTWVASGKHWRKGQSLMHILTGTINLPGALDRLSIVATTSTFDAGSVNIMYE